MGEKRYFCSHCNDFVSRGTRSNHLKEMAEANETSYDTDNSDLDSESFDPCAFDLGFEGDNEDLVGGSYSHRNSDAETSEDPETTQSCFANLDEEDRRLFDEAFIHESIGETEDLNETLFCEQVHSTNEELWDDLVEENVMEDLDETNFPGAVEADGDSYNRTTLINWVLIFICYLWTYCNIADRGIELMLQFLHAFFTVLSQRIPWMSLFVASFPSSLYLLKKHFGFHKDCFQKFVVCPKCNSLYNYDSAFEAVGSRRLSKKCSYVEFPNHRNRAHRKPCNEVLLKEVKLQDGKTKLYPKKVYCYSSIIGTLKLFLQRAGFTSRCELWRGRERTSIPGLLSDVIHGTVWRDFKGPDGSRFMSHPRNLAFMMNVDWFQPFKHSPYSVGVIYLALMNLPRAERFKRENIIVVGILPGPGEPSSLNPFLIPVVAELKELWENGIEVCHSGSPKVPQKFFAALLLVACDVPAARKLCGFLGHGAKRGCSKCKKEFIPGKHFGDKMNFGGFENCLHRTNEEHRSEAQEILLENTFQGRNDKQTKYGTRYSELMQLEYFDCIRFTIVDPMHNLFLGTAKHMMKNVWLPNKVLKQTDLKSIQELIDNMKVPCNIGRIPNKIASSFGSFTSDQWKLWTVVYSEFALKNYLPREDYRLWLLFVKACRVLTAPVITIRSLAEAHSSLIQFCRKFESMYGQLEVTPNMHLHSHLINCILDYGPVHNFWLFSFERFNGVLGDFMHTYIHTLFVMQVRKNWQHIADVDLLTILTKIKLSNG